MDDFKPDELMETVARAMGKLYPTPGSMRWADRLAAEHGEALVIRAIAYVVVNGAQPHEVLSQAEDALEYRAQRVALNEERAKAAEVAQARQERTQAEVKRWQDQAKGFEPVSPERVAEIMGRMPWEPDR